MPYAPTRRDLLKQMIFTGASIGLPWLLSTGEDKEPATEEELNRELPAPPRHPAHSLEGQRYWEMPQVFRLEKNSPVSCEFEPMTQIRWEDQRPGDVIVLRYRDKNTGEWDRRASCCYQVGEEGLLWDHCDLYDKFGNPAVVMEAEPKDIVGMMASPSE